jgi:argininosuccinate lyase
LKLWQKGNTDQTLKNIESFTIGKDQELDIHLAKFDLLGNIAHSIMLHKVGLLEKHELDSLLRECKDINENLISKNKFVIEEGIEDVHSQIELELTKTLGDVGKKIHSGRSRNDQVLVDLKMYLRNEQCSQKRLSPRLYPFTDCNAIIFWFMVWCLCRKPN